MASRGDSGWGSLSEGMKRVYTSEGVTAGPYNRWSKLSQLERTKVTRQAREAGYSSGLNYFATQAQIRQHTGKRMPPSTTPQEAARKLLKGSKRGSPARKKIPQLFNFSEFDHVEWENFLSP